MKQLYWALARKLARRYRKQWILYALPLVPALVIFMMVLFVGMFVVVEAGALNSNGCGSSAPTLSDASNVKTAVDFVHYLESQGIAPNGAAGIVGNLQQESGLNPKEAGGGLAQWNPGWYATMVSWVSGRGMNPASAAGQLTYLVHDLQSSYQKLLAELNSATSPEEAATMFETTYELCSGVVGYMQVLPNSLCNDPARRSYALAALKASGGVSLPVNTGQCVGLGGEAGDPIPGFSPSRDDMGVDACVPGNRPLPVLAPQQSTLVDVIPNWFRRQPLLLFQFNPPLTGTYKGDQYWFVAEEITPVTEKRGTVFGPGQPVAHFAPSGTCIEIGWGDPTANSRTLGEATGRRGDFNPPKGALTPEAEAFKTYFHIPWVGQSP